MSQTKWSIIKLYSYILRIPEILEKMSYPRYITQNPQWIKKQQCRNNKINQTIGWLGFAIYYSNNNFQVVVVLVGTVAGPEDQSDVYLTKPLK